MPKLTYRIEYAPGKIYGKNSNELTFKEPSSNALVYSTATESSGLLKKVVKKQLYRGPAGGKNSGVCVATIDEPSHASGTTGTETLELHHHRRHSGKKSGGDGDDGEEAKEEETASTSLRLKKASSWTPALISGGDSHGWTFRGEGYAWSGGKGRLRRDGDGRTMASLVGPWFWEAGKVGALEVDVPEMGDEDERRDLLEMVLATFVARWWGDKVAAEERAKEAERKRAEDKKKAQEEKKAVAKQKEAEKKEDEQAAQSKKAAEAQNAGEPAGEAA